jgi:orotidine-5'-phosphate decarboxylase
MTPNPDVKKKLCLALDVSDAKAAQEWVDRTQDWVGVYKIGLQLYSGHGPRILDTVLGAMDVFREHCDQRIFLDLKLHDIPNTVAGAVRSIRDLDSVDYLTVHTGGGGPMMEAAVEAAGADIQILGVTVLTSLNNTTAHEVGIALPLGDTVVDRAAVAAAAGVTGFVCSPLEVARLRAALPTATLVVPGIRLAGDSKGDQERVATPKATIDAGASILVLGRMVRSAKNPLTVLQMLHDSLAS